MMEQYSNDLGAEDDDVVADTPSPIPQHSLFSAPHAHSQPAGRVLVERNRECEARCTNRNQEVTVPYTTKSKTRSAGNRSVCVAGRFQAELTDDYVDPRQLWTTRDVAMRVHSSFRSTHVSHRRHGAGSVLDRLLIRVSSAG